MCLTHILCSIRGNSLLTAAINPYKHKKKKDDDEPIVNSEEGYQNRNICGMLPFADQKP